MRNRLPGAGYAIFLLLLVLFIADGCTKIPKGGYTNVTPPAVVTLNIISLVTTTSAVSGGIVTNTNGSNTTANGVCWSSTNQTPTVSDPKTTDTVNVNGWTSKMTGLSPGTTYYLRAYASNSGGVSYGAVMTFTTSTSINSVTSTVSTIAGSTSGTYGFTDGPGVSALLSGPNSIAYNSIANNFFFTDNYNNAIRTMTTAGAVSTYSNTALGYINGPIASALFYAPVATAFDAQGNIYVADLGNNLIRKITTTGVVSTLAGNGVNGYVDGTGATVTEFSSPSGLAVDATGNVYVADRGNQVIRKITPAGVVSTVAGFGPGQVNSTGNQNVGHIAGYYDSSIPTDADFDGPTAVALDGKGNLYIADIKNHAIRTFSITSNSVSTLAGNPVQTTTIGSPIALTCDANGNLFIVDQNGRILEITATTHILYVLAGSATASGYQDGVGTSALFNGPLGIAADPQGNLYVADFNNNVIRKIVVKIQ